jgi:hypothetical protein
MGGYECLFTQLNLIFKDEYGLNVTPKRQSYDHGLDYLLTLHFSTFYLDEKNPQIYIFGKQRNVSTTSPNSFDGFY